MDVEWLRWQFEDGRYGVITKNGFKIGVRHVQMLYMLMTAITVGVMRGSMGIVVLAINDHTRLNDTYIQIYKWDGKIRGAVLSSFFFGYALMLVPSELFLKKICGKFLTTTMLLINGVLFVAIPTIVNKGGWLALCNAKFLMGASQACFFIVNQSLLDTWLPPNERKIFNYVVYGGIKLGIIISLPISGLLSTARLGWELVYYALGILTLSMAAITVSLTASSPIRHPAVGDTEKEYIKETLNLYRKKSLQKPWRDVFTSPSFWAVTCAHGASSCLFVFCLVYAPAYLMRFKLSLKDSAQYCMIPFITMAVVYLVTEPIMNWIFNIKYVYLHLSTSFYRKSVNAFGAIGIIMGLIMLMDFPQTISDCPKIIIFTIILGCLGFQFCGFLSTYRDMSENFSGTLIMLSCSFSSIFSGSMTFVFGLILGDHAHNLDVDLFRWRVIFFTLSSLYLVCTIMYTIFGSNKRQYWDHINHKGYYNIVADIDKMHLEENVHKTIDTAV